MDPDFAPRAPAAFSTFTSEAGITYNMASATHRKSPYVDWFFLLLNGFDNNVQFQQLPQCDNAWKDAFLTREDYTNTQDMYYHSLSSEKRKEFRYCNNVVVLFQAMYHARAEYQHPRFWTCISRGFGGHERLVKDMVGSLCQARNTHLSFHFAGTSGATSSTEPARAVDNWINFRNSEREAMPGARASVSNMPTSEFAAMIEDFFSSVKGGRIPPTPRTDPPTPRITAIPTPRATPGPGPGPTPTGPAALPENLKRPYTTSSGALSQRDEDPKRYRLDAPPAIRDSGQWRSSPSAPRATRPSPSAPSGTRPMMHGPATPQSRKENTIDSIIQSCTREDTPRSKMREDTPRLKLREDTPRPRTKEETPRPKRPAGMDGIPDHESASNATLSPRMTGEADIGLVDIKRETQSTTSSWHHNTKISVLQEEISALKARLAQKERESEQKEKECTQKDMENRELTKRLDAHDAAITELRAEIKALSGSVRPVLEKMPLFMKGLSGVSDILTHTKDQLRAKEKEAKEKEAKEEEAKEEEAKEEPRA